MLNDRVTQQSASKPSILNESSASVAAAAAASLPPPVGSLDYILSLAVRQYQQQQLFHQQRQLHHLQQIQQEQRQRVLELYLHHQPSAGAWPFAVDTPPELKALSQPSAASSSSSSTSDISSVTSVASSPSSTMAAALTSPDATARRLQHHHQTQTQQQQMAMGRKKKTRTVFTRNQVLQLESMFDARKYLSSSERSQLAGSLHLSETQVKIWFQNRRNKCKRHYSALELTSLASNAFTWGQII